MNPIFRTRIKNNIAAAWGGVSGVALRAPPDQFGCIEFNSRWGLSFRMIDPTETLSSDPTTGPADRRARPSSGPCKLAVESFHRVPTCSQHAPTACPQHAPPCSQHAPPCSQDAPNMPQHVPSTLEHADSTLQHTSGMPQRSSTFLGWPQHAPACSQHAPACSQHV